VQIARRDSEFKPTISENGTSRLIGLKVKLPDPCRQCGSHVAIITPGTKPHAHGLRCDCGYHRGWMSRSTAAWLDTIVQKFGCPDGPIRLRRGPMP